MYDPVEESDSLFMSILYHVVGAVSALIVVALNILVIAILIKVVF